MPPAWPVRLRQEVWAALALALAMTLTLVLAPGTAAAAAPAPDAVDVPALAEAATSCPPAAMMPPLPGAQRPVAAAATDRGFLWRIEKGGHASWLYGTLHVGKADWLIPGPRVMSALRQADTIALELDPLDTTSMQGMLAPGDPQRLAEVMTTGRAARLERQWKAACVGNEGGARARLRPLLQVTVLALLAGRVEGLYGDFGIDAMLAGVARGARKPLVALETVESQLALLTADTAEEEATQIDQALDELESGRLRGRLSQLATMWADSDLAMLGRYAEWCDCLQTPAERKQMAQLLDQRNPHLADGIEALHVGGKHVFAAVGSLHMVGATGLPELMRQRGFKVTLLVPAR